MLCLNDTPPSAYKDSGFCISSQTLAVICLVLISILVAVKWYPFEFEKKYIFILFYVNGCFSCMHICVSHDLVPIEVKEGIRPLELGLWMV